MVTFKESKCVVEHRHLFFADDSLIMMIGDMSNTLSLHNALDMYCASLGQLVGDTKSSIFQSGHRCAASKGSMFTFEYFD
jgi:hypothetical protein